MKFYTKYFLLLFTLFFSFSCNTINYKKVDNLDIAKTKINTVKYFLSKNFIASQINCIIVGKVTDKTKNSEFKNLNKAEIIRKAVYGLISVKNYDLIKLSKIDKKLTTVSEKNLLKNYDCDAILTGQIIKFYNDNFISFSNTTVEIKLELKDKESNLLWASRYSANSSEGSIPLSPVSLITGVFQVASNDKNEIALQVVDKVSRKILNSFPEKQINLKNEFELKNKYKGNSVDTPQNILEFFENEEYEKASIALKKRILNNKNNPENYFLESKSSFFQENYISSINYSLEAASKGLNTSENYSILGISYLKLNNLKLAYASLFKALNLDPNSSITNFNYALINEIQGVHDIAAERYYFAGLISIEEKNYVRLYKSLKSLQRLSRRGKKFNQMYNNLNNEVLVILERIKYKN